MESVPRILVLGLGNDILTDDSIGLRVVQALEESWRDHPEISVARTTEMGLALLDLVVGFKTLIVVDAVHTSQSPPGTVHEMDLDQFKRLPSASPHFLGLGEVLALGRKLEMAMPERVTIFGIEVQDPFTVGTQLSQPLEAALPSIIDKMSSAVKAVASASRG